MGRPPPTDLLTASRFKQVSSSPGVEAEPFNRGRKWRNLPRWKRRAAYATAALFGLGTIWAATAATVRPTTETETESETTSDPTTPAATPADEPGAPNDATPETETEAVPSPPSMLPATELAPSVPTPSIPTPSVPTPVVPTPTVPGASVPGAMPALDVLAAIRVERERPSGYDRDLFEYGSEPDGFGCRTRAKVLIRDSLTPAQVDPVGCAVVAGDWYSRYDGLTWSDPAEVEIDHVVALKEAWDSGAWAWDPARLAAFGNDLDDPRTLAAVTGSANRDKGDKDPSNWIPARPEAVCTYIADWTAIKARWGLSMDESEHGRIRNLLNNRCPGHTIATWPPAPAAAATATATTTLPPVPVPTIAPAPAGLPAAGNCDPSYPSVCIAPAPPDLDCGDIPYRRFDVQQPDPHGFDRDRDGVGCES